MDAAWVGAIGAVIGGGIGGTLGVGGALWSARKLNQGADKAARIERRTEAYVDFIAAAVAAGSMVVGVRTFLGIESGVKASPLFRGTRAASTIEIGELYRRDLDRLMHAASRVWTVGSQDAITSANEVVNHVMSLMGLSAQSGGARGRVGTTVYGNRWTEDQQRELSDGVNRLAHLRKAFTELARRETGQPFAQLFTNDSTDSDATG